MSYLFLGFKLLKQSYSMVTCTNSEISIIINDSFLVDKISTWFSFNYVVMIFPSATHFPRHWIGRIYTHYTVQRCNPKKNFLQIFTLEEKKLHDRKMWVCFFSSSGISMKMQFSVFVFFRQLKFRCISIKNKG